MHFRCPLAALSMWFRCVVEGGWTALRCGWRAGAGTETHHLFSVRGNAESLERSAGVCRAPLQRLRLAASPRTHSSSPRMSITDLARGRRHDPDLVLPSSVYSCLERSQDPGVASP